MKEEESLIHSTHWYFLATVNFWEGTKKPDTEEREDSLPQVVSSIDGTHLTNTMAGYY